MPSMMWYQNFDTYVLHLRFKCFKYNHHVYFKFSDDHLLFIVLYIDGMLLRGKWKVL